MEVLEMTVQDIMNYVKLVPLNENVLRTMLNELVAENTNDYNAKLPEEAFEVNDENWGSDQYYIIRANNEWILVEPEDNGGEVS